jgi:hypothetical protein
LIERGLNADTTFELEVRNGVSFEGYIRRKSLETRRMLIQTDEKAVTLTPFGSLAINGAASASRSGGKSWTEMIRTALSQAGHKRSDPPPISLSRF